MKKVLLFLLCTFSFLLSCNIFGIQEQKVAGCGCVAALPVAIFGKTYLNWAWGFDHHAWYLTESGSIDTVAYTRADSLWTVNDDSMITYSEMEHLLGNARPVTQYIRQVTLDSMKALIPLAAAGPWSKSAQGKDMGICTYSAFYYDSLISGYREVLLYQSGDTKIINESDAAKKLTTWLMGIDSTTIGNK